MSLHDRIKGLKKYAKPGNIQGGLDMYNSGLNDAAQIAKEADELMAEMALALEEAMEWNWMDEIEPVPDRVEYQVADVLRKYKAMKESTK